MVRSLNRDADCLEHRFVRTVTRRHGHAPFRSRGGRFSVSVAVAALKTAEGKLFASLIQAQVSRARVA